MGRNNPFHKLVRGIGILPSRAMKNFNRDYSDWGDEKMTGEFRHLFIQLFPVWSLVICLVGGVDYDYAPTGYYYEPRYF